MTTRVIRRGGEVEDLQLSAAQQLALYAARLHADTGGYIEVAVARRTRTGGLVFRDRSDPRRYTRAGDWRTLARHCAQYTRMGLEVFASPIPRPVAAPGSGPVRDGRVVWVDVDSPESQWRLDAFARRPHLIVNSGRGRHAYWAVDQRLLADELDSANRRLARLLRGDSAAVDRGRLLRLPGSINHKNGAPCRVLLCDLARPPYTSEQLIGDLPDPKRPRPPREGTRCDDAGSDAAEQVPPVEYMRIFGNVDAIAGRKVNCPLPDHDDRTPSCHVYDDVDRGWFCFGCRRGGSIYDLAALMLGLPQTLDDETFIDVKRHVHERLGLPDPFPSIPDRRVHSAAAAA